MILETRNQKMEIQASDQEATTPSSLGPVLLYTGFLKERVRANSSCTRISILQQDEGPTAGERTLPSRP